MYFIVENSEQLSRLEPCDEAFIQIVTSNDNYHPKLARPSLVYYNGGKKGYVFVINHSEGFSLEINLVQDFLSRHKQIYLLDKKLHSYFLTLPQAVDLQFINLDRTNEFNPYECSTAVHRDFHIRYSGLSRVNEIIPIAKHYERCECLYKKVQDLFGLEGDLHLQNRFIAAYKGVEETGIRIDLDRFRKQYQPVNERFSISGDRIYSSYNLYNLTARPTNAFNGVNFLAIPKDEAYRQCFIPSNDYLVEFDFDAYHLRLISSLIGFTPPSESMHEYLGRIYFNTDKLTEEQYKESKGITFKQLYGGIEKEWEWIPFFKALKTFIDGEWSKYQAQKVLVLPTGRILKKSPGMNKLKLFNYIVQNLETRENISKIESINALLADKATKLILITYDSFLFDFAKADGKQLLTEIKTLLEGQNMLVKHKWGQDYAF